MILKIIQVLEFENIVVRLDVHVYVATYEYC